MKILRDGCRRLNLDLQAAETGLLGAREIPQVDSMRLLRR